MKGSCKRQITIRVYPFNVQRRVRVRYPFEGVDALSRSVRSVRVLPPSALGLRMRSLNQARGAALVAAALCCVLFACDRGGRSTSTDSAATKVLSAIIDSTRPPVGTGWELDAGPFLILPTVDGGRDAGSILRPDANDSTVGDTVGLHALAGAGVMELFARGGVVGQARLTVEKSIAVDSGCAAWPVARFVAIEAGAPTHPWTAAFLKGRITAVALDSIEGLSAKDSAMMAANISRLASGLPDDTVATFHGLPFVVLRAFRGQAAGRSFVVTTLVRRVNQEDAPREERLVMVIDGDPTAFESWTVGWHERASGREDELVVSEPLVAFQVTGKPDAHLLFGRDDGEALSAAMLVRGPKAWKVLWESALAGCDH